MALTALQAWINVLHLQNAKLEAIKRELQASSKIAFAPRVQKASTSQRHTQPRALKQRSAVRAGLFVKRQLQVIASVLQSPRVKMEQTRPWEASVSAIKRIVDSALLKTATMESCLSRKIDEHVPLPCLLMERHALRRFLFIQQQIWTTLRRAEMCARQLLTATPSPSIRSLRPQACVECVVCLLGMSCPDADLSVVAD